MEVISRRRILQAGFGVTGLLVPSLSAWVWAQSEGATKLLRAPKRALVIGNAGYRNVPALKNPANDAGAIAAALGECGFAVTTLIDATREQMDAGIADFVKEVGARKAVGLFYFAGHGLQLAWHNYLLPVDARIRAQSEIPAQSIDVATLLGGIGKATNPMNVIVLDACRDNPFGDFRVEHMGLSQVDAPSGTLLAYSTAPGNVAADGNGANGLYTENLLREMKVREAKIEDVFKRVRLAVRRASRGQQVPWESTSLEEDFYFIPPESLKKLSRDEEDRAFAAELALFEKARNSKNAAPLEEYLQRFPSGKFSELAQPLLDRILAAQGEKLVEPEPAAGNPNTAGSARADMRFQVGDSYTFRSLRNGRENRESTEVVTRIEDDQVVFNEGERVIDLLGNPLRFRDGRRFGWNQHVPLEYSVGKRWTTRFDVAGGAGGTARFSFRIVTREKIVVPAGAFECFRIEGRGTNESAFRPSIEGSVTIWNAPGEVRVPVAQETEWYSSQGHESTRRELVRFHQA